VPLIPKSIDAAARNGANWPLGMRLTYVSVNNDVQVLDSGLRSLANDTVLLGSVDSQTDLVQLTLNFGSLPIPGSNPSFACDGFLVPPSDSVPTSITLTTPPEGAVYTLGQVVIANYACQDELGGAGLASCAGNVASGAAIDTGSVGAKTFTVTAANNAGNTSSLTHHYQVDYSFGGFLAPANNPSTVNTGKAGRTYPVKWQLRNANGSFISALGAARRRAGRQHLRLPGGRHPRARRAPRPARDPPEPHSGAPAHRRPRGEWRPYDRPSRCRDDPFRRASRRRQLRDLGIACAFGGRRDRARSRRCSSTGTT